MIVFAMHIREGKWMIKLKFVGSVKYKLGFIEYIKREFYWKVCIFWMEIYKKAMQVWLKGIKADIFILIDCKIYGIAIEISYLS